MHELSIAQAVVDIAARTAGGAAVTSVRLRVGRMRQVVPASLEFSFELCASGTPVQGAVLEIEEVAVGVRCRSCGTYGEPVAFPLSCAACGGLAVDVVQGEELQVESLEIEAELSRSER